MFSVTDTPGKRTVVARAPSLERGHLYIVESPDGEWPTSYDAMRSDAWIYGVKAKHRAQIQANIQAQAIVGLVSRRAG